MIDNAKSVEIYDSLSRPPKEALKQIKGGRLQGMSDITPQWRYKAMTEKFGLCGIGWKYTIDKQWTEPGSDGQTMCFANVSVYVKDGDKWSDPIPGTGGSMIVEKEKSGLHTNDEGYKMCVTDALSVAMKYLGVAAAIYAGLWDGSEYKDGGGVNEVLEQWADYITSAADMADLQAKFSEAWSNYKGDTEAQRYITDIKDKRKKELQ